MSWNYRIVRDVQIVGGTEHESFTIREVYYDDQGNPNSWSLEPSHPYGETWQEVCDDHAIMGRACGQPVIDVSTGKAVVVSLRELHERRTGRA